MLSLSIPELLSILLNILATIVKIAIIFVIGWLGGELTRWIWRSLFVPLFQRRAYFYVFKEDSEGFYVEKPLKILWFRLKRNKRWALQKDLVGYVARRTGGSNSDAGDGSLQAANDIFFTSFSSKEHVGQVKSPAEKTLPGGGKTRICEVIIKRSNIEGDEYYDTPVGYINEKGEVYKYYKDRNHALRGKKSEKAILVGYARAPQLQERKTFSGSFDTDAEAALNGIDDTNSASEWFFFRKRKKSCVKAQKIAASTTNKGLIALWTAGWRVLHAYLADGNSPERKMRPWGIGYAIADFWRNKDAGGFGLDARAVAALLLAEKEGFYLRDAEQIGENKKGLWPTALLSLVLYLCVFPFLNQIEALEHWFEGLAGPQISKTISLILLFFALWLIVHFIRMMCYDATNRFESFLYKMNNNVGTMNWNTWLIVTSAIGLVLSIFVVDYLFFPIFFCALIVFIGQRFVYGSYPWPVENPLDDAGEDSDESDDKSEDEEEDKDCDERIEHSASINAMGNTHVLEFTIPYRLDELKKLRAKNPFREGNTSEYAKRVHDMIEQEYGGEIYSQIKYVKDKIDRFVAKHNLSFMEKIDLILKLSQPNNISYQYDWNSEELLPQADEPVPNPSLLKRRDDVVDAMGYAEYCRFPTETLHDKRGDCDCHAALAVSLLAACGIRCCYFTNKTNDDTGHAALGIEVTKELQKLVGYQNCFTYHGIPYLYAEATGHGRKVGEVPPGFERMLEKGDDYAIIEPADFNTKLNHEE